MGQAESMHCFHRSRRSFSVLLQLTQPDSARGSGKPRRERRYWPGGRCPHGVRASPASAFRQERDVSALATNLGFPRIGLNRELKKALEGYWNGQTTWEQLAATGK